MSEPAESNSDEPRSALERGLLRRQARELFDAGRHHASEELVASYSSPTDIDLSRFERMSFERASRRSARVKRALEPLRDMVENGAADAYDQVIAAIEEHGSRAQLHALAAQAATDDQRTVHHLRRACGLDRTNRSTALALAQMLFATGKADEARTVAADAGLSDNAALIELARSVTSEGSLDGNVDLHQGILDAVAALEQEPFKSYTASRLQAMLAMLGVTEPPLDRNRAPQFAKRRGLLRSEHESDPTDVAGGRRYAQFLVDQQQLDEATRVAMRYEHRIGGEIAPTELEVVLLPDRFARQGVALGETLERLSRFANSWPKSRVAILRSIQNLPVDQALVRLRELAAADLTGAARTLVALRLAALERVAVLRQQMGRREREIIESEIVALMESTEPVRQIATGSDTTILHFHSLRANPADGFGSGVHWLLRSTGANIIYVADTRSLYSMGGIEHVEGGLDGAIAHLRDRLGALGTKRLVTNGTSSGTYAAIRYGVALKADSMILTDPVTRIDSDMQLMDGRAATMWARFQRELPDGFGSLRAELEASPQTDVHLFYAAAFRPDVAQVRHVSDLPNVTTHPVEGLDRHAALVMVIADGSFEKSMLDAVRPTPVV